jgi:hypothetical protein
MDIIQSFYYSSDSIRQKEIEHALHSNLNKDFVKGIHLFIEEKDYDLFIKSVFITHEKYNKITLVKFEGQPKYSELFKYGSDLEDKLCCICNSDIEFDIEQTNIQLLDQLYNDNMIYFLTRHEYDMSCPLIKNFGGSHDAFIFHSNTLKLNIENKDTTFIDYIQNTSGIEALLAIFFIEHLNYKIFNPCLQIKLIHHHKSQIRLWNRTTSGRKIVGYTHPTPLNVNHGVHNKHMIYPCRL